MSDIDRVTMKRTYGVERHFPLPPVTVEGIVLETPMERYEHSRWLTLRTAQGRLVRVMVACSAPVANWAEAGDLVRVHGRMVEKRWQDGWYETLSGHEGIEIVNSRLSMYGGVSA